MHKTLHWDQYFRYTSACPLGGEINWTNFHWEGGSFSCQAIHLLGETESGGQFFGRMEGGKFTFSKIKSQFLHIHIRSLIPFQVQINNKN